MIQQITNFDNSWPVYNLPNPNWAMFLRFVDSNATGLWFLAIALIFLPLGFIVAMRAIKLEYIRAPKAEEQELLFTVQRAGSVVFSCNAYDVEIEKHAYLNFLGPDIGDGCRNTVAILPWTGREEISSKAAADEFRS